MTRPKTRWDRTRAAAARFLRLPVVTLLVAAPVVAATSSVPAKNRTKLVADGALWPAICADGRFVAYQGSAGGRVRSASDVVLRRDLRSGRVVVASVDNARTTGGNDISYTPSISANGRFVAFASDASDLVPGDGNGYSDVFVRDLVRRRTYLVSVNAAGTGPADRGGSMPSISGNGRYVAFRSISTDLVQGVSVGQQVNVFVRDLERRRTELVSVSSAGTAEGNGTSEFPSISRDGRVVAFYSQAGDLVSGSATSALVHVYARDMKLRTTTLVSFNSANTAPADGDSINATVSANGRFVAFQSWADDLVAGDANGRWDVFVRDLKHAVTTRASIANLGSEGGAYTMGTYEGGIPTLSGDGRFVTFCSGAPDFVGTADTIGAFVRDLRSGTTTTVTLDSSGTALADGYSTEARICANGRFVVFQSSATNLVPGQPTDAAARVFVRRVR